jgi:hypothetical protein
VFGEAHDQLSAPESVEELIGWGWIFALYTPAAIARGRPWQAEYTINGTRENGLALACLRFGLPTDHRRGVDRLPGGEATRPWEAARVRSLEPDELRRALSAASSAFVDEVCARLCPARRAAASVASDRRPTQWRLTPSVERRSTRSSMPEP